MKNKQHILHPATFYFLLTLFVVFLSWILDIYGWSATETTQGEIFKVQSLLNPEGIRWWLRNVVSNYTGFAPLGMVLVAMLGIGIADDSGLLKACARRWSSKYMQEQNIILWTVIIGGIISNIIGDAGYIFLVPLAAGLFKSVGMHPAAGILIAYVSVACGYSANFFISTLDPLIAGVTREAASRSGIEGVYTGALSNYLFMAVSALLIAGTIYFISRRWLLLVLKPSRKEENKSHPLSHKEQRAMKIAFISGGIYLLVILAATFSPWGILRGITGGMTRSPFIFGTHFLISFALGLMGTVYGITAERYRNNREVADGLARSMKPLASYIVITFFAAQMFACIHYSQIDRCLLLNGAQSFKNINADPLLDLLLFIFFIAVANLLTVSSLTKWSLLSSFFLPFFTSIGVEAEWVQCAYRIGDSATNAASPFMFYLPLVFVCLQTHLISPVGYRTIFHYTIPYTLAIFFVWTLLFIIWYLFPFAPIGM